MRYWFIAVGVGLLLAHLFGPVAGIIGALLGGMVAVLTEEA